MSALFLALAQQEKYSRERTLQPDEQWTNPLFASLNHLMELCMWGFRHDAAESSTTWWNHTATYSDRSLQAKAQSSVPTSDCGCNGSKPERMPLPTAPFAAHLLDVNRIPCCTRMRWQSSANDVSTKLTAWETQWPTQRGNLNYTSTGMTCGGSPTVNETQTQPRCTRSSWFPLPGHEHFEKLCSDIKPANICSSLLEAINVQKGWAQSCPHSSAVRWNWTNPVWSSSTIWNPKLLHFR